MVTTIVIGVFIAGMIAMTIWALNSTLDKLQLLPGEQRLKDYKNLWVGVSGGGPETTIFKNARIVLTDQRLVVAQKMLGRNKYVLRYFIYFAADSGNFGLTRGVVELRLGPASVNLLEDKRKYLRLSPADNLFFNHIDVGGEDIEELYSALNKIVASKSITG